MEGLGIDLKLLLAQIFNFLVLLFILKKFLYKPLLKFLDERKKKIEESLLNAEKINKELANIEQQKKKILEEARVEAARMIAQEKKTGEELREQITEEAKRKAQEELRKGTVLARQEFEKARSLLRQEAVALGQVMAKKILEELPGDKKRELIERAVS